jgi:hypothetical protein
MEHVLNQDLRASLDQQRNPAKAKEKANCHLLIIPAAVFALVSMAFGIRSLILSNSLLNFRVDSEGIKWLAIVWALHEAMPGLIFIGYTPLLQTQ